MAQEKGRNYSGIANDTQRLFAAYAKAAQDTCRGTGLLASVALVQAAIESGWGKSGLAAKYNNFGGIKAHWDWKGKVVVLPAKC